MIIIEKFIKELSPSMAPAYLSCHGGATSANKGYNAAPEYRLGLRHIAQKAAQRRIAKTLDETNLSLITKYERLQ